MSIAWDYLVELRKELVEAQKIRAQVTGFKITFITASLGFLLANAQTLDRAMFVLPALSAVFFDFLINSYSFSVKRIGSYVREYIEPVIEKESAYPEGFVLWQDFLTQTKTKQRYSRVGNLGLTVLTEIVALAALLMPYRCVESSLLIALVLLFSILDFQSFWQDRKLKKPWRSTDFKPMQDS
jgi:hypothetical protein